MTHHNVTGIRFAQLFFCQFISWNVHRFNTFYFFLCKSAHCTFYICENYSYQVNVQLTPVVMVVMYKICRHINPGNTHMTLKLNFNIPMLSYHYSNSHYKDTMACLYLHRNCYTLKVGLYFEPGPRHHSGCLICAICHYPTVRYFFSKKTSPGHLIIPSEGQWVLW